MFGSSPMLPPGILPQVPTLAPSDSGFYSHGNPSSVQVKIVIFMFLAPTGAQEEGKLDLRLSVRLSVYFMHSSFVEAFKQCN